MAINLRGSNESTYSNDVTFNGDISAPLRYENRASDGKVTMQSTTSTLEVRTTQTDGAVYAPITLKNGCPTNSIQGGGTTVYQVRADGAVKLGGTLPASPNITLNADGTSEFEGQMAIKSNKIGSVEDAALSLAGTGGDFYALDFTSADITIMSVSSSSKRLSFRSKDNGTVFEIFDSGLIRAAGIYSQTVSVSTRDVFVDSNGSLGYVSSVRASKGNINPLSDVSWLYNLNPVSFNYRKKTESGTYSESELEPELNYGLIAEEVAEVAPEVCYYSQDGELEGVGYKQLIIPLLAALKEQATRIEALEAEVQSLKGGI